MEGHMPTMLDVLGRDHDEIRRVLAELETGPTTAPGADIGQLARRQEIVGELVIAVSRHEAIEEMYFWPAVREHHPDGDELADAAIGQEQESKDVLDLLGRLHVGQPEFEGVLGAFTRAARDHLLFEETEVWPGLAAAITAREAATLGQKLEQGKEAAPTRPYPGAPAQPGVLTAAGAVATAVDWLRDAISGRGQH
jgi:hypothetical protein